jgi:integrase/recombinase XerD
MIMDRCERVQVTGPLAGVAAGFQRSLAEQGYSLYSANAQLLLMAHVSRWLAGRMLDGVDLTEARAQEFLRARRADGYAHPVSMRGMRPLLEYLRAAGVTPMPDPLDVATPVDVLIEHYRIYLIEERGLSTSSTVRHYCTVARAFLAHRSITAEVELMGLTTADVTDFVLWQSRRCSVGYAKAITTRLRCLLRFLHVEGLTSSALAAAVPSVAGWRLTGLPETISASDVSRLLDSCDRHRTVGRRDFAILKVLARLGLRTSEVAALQLEDIDWRISEVTVRGKGNREDRLPLPHDVGEAIAGWLRHGRPRCASRAVFTRVLAPHRGLSGRGVSTVVRQACGRAGLPLMGAHRLRHCVATQLLSAGANLVEIGQVLRHHSLTSTSIYAKVDRRTLSAVVQPWPGGAA